MVRHAPNRIAIVSHVHPSMSKGGAEISAYSLFTALKRLGHDAIFITGCAEGDRAKLALGSPREHAVFFDPQFYDHFYHLASPTVTMDLARIVETQKVDLLNFHHFMNFGVSALRMLAHHPAIRSVLTIHEFLAICRNDGQMVTRPARQLCERASPAACGTCFPERAHQHFALRRNLFLDAFAGVDGFVSPSRFLADRFVRWGLPPERIAVIENGLAHLPDPGPARRDGRPWVFGFFGQINPFKGVDTILHAAELIGRDAELSERIRIRIHGNIIGQPEAFVTRLLALADKYPFLSFAGPYDNAAVGRLMSECDYVVVPSNWWENSPVVIREAYAVRRPVICTGIGGMAEKVEDGVTGLHFRHADYDDLMRVMNHAANPEIFGRLCAGIPEVTDAIAMAHAYLAAFAQFSTGISAGDNDAEAMSGSNFRDWAKGAA